MYPVQISLRGMLKTQWYPSPLVSLVLGLCLARVAWAATDSIAFINQTEMDVYVDIRIHGASGSAGPRSVIAKQFLILLFWGHWVGCLAYALRSFIISPWGASMMGNS